MVGLLPQNPPSFLARCKSTLQKRLKLSGRTVLPDDFAEMGARDLVLTRRNMSKSTGDFGSKESS